MGRRGPPPQPTQLSLVKGNPGKRALNPHEPKAKGSLGAPPEWLDVRAKAAWRSLATTIGDMRLESASDRKALELLCATYAEWRTADDEVKAAGITYSRTTAEGEIIILAHPAVAIRADAMRRVHRMLLEFGLTPSARSRVSTKDGQSADPLDAFLSRGRSPA